MSQPRKAYCVGFTLQRTHVLMKLKALLVEVQCINGCCPMFCTAPLCLWLQASRAVRLCHILEKTNSMDRLQASNPREPPRFKLPARILDIRDWDTALKYISHSDGEDAVHQACLEYCRGYVLRVPSNQTNRLMHCILNDEWALIMSKATMQCAVVCTQDADSGSWGLPVCALHI